MVSADEYDKFLKHCEKAQKEVRKAQGQFRTYETEVLHERRERLDRTEAWGTMEDLIHEELMLLVNLMIFAVNNRKDLDAKELTRWSDIVTKIDRQARKAKSDLPYRLGLASTRSFTQWKTDKVVLRDLALKHWGVVDAMAKEKEKLPPMLKSHVDEIEKALKNVGWLFVVFICYAKEDGKYVNDLFRFCQPQLEKANHLVLWFGDRRSFEDMHAQHGKPFDNRGGHWWETNVALNKWHGQLLDHIDDVDLGITLVSERFFDLEYIKKQEFLDILRDRQEEGMRIFPVILDKHKWEEHRWLRSTDFLPHPGKTVMHDYGDEKNLRRLYCEEFVTRLRGMVTDLSDVEKVRLP
ncbi:MAG: hypothetical protein P0120_07535 [Nitrospira sp.]|nr:hypothetical protein [Nitrospira sp.]